MLICIYIKDGQHFPLLDLGVFQAAKSLFKTNMVLKYYHSLKIEKYAFLL